MIHTKELRFNYDHIDFEASVTYSDLPFSQSIRDMTSVFYDVKLLKPKVLECGGEVKQIQGIAGMMIYAKQANDRQYSYIEENQNKVYDKSINVYPLAVRKILYSYFNQEKIAEYTLKVTLFNEAIDKKYALKLEMLREEKLLLKKRLRLTEINSQAYQKLYTPIRKKKEEIAFNISHLKYRFKLRYFQCCELRPKYCTFKTEKDTSSGDILSLCRLTAHLARIQKKTKC
ncbi:MAG: hypothetical protein GQ531_10495 [Sulfurovum sp.]|nr:hypothetical protein [Sulfurovum sp.]